jgi:hypothetical protein
MSEQWLYDLELDNLDKISQELKKRKPRHKKPLPPIYTYQEYLDRDKARPKSKYEVPYYKGELSV